jgi:hypothetical protein
MMTDRESNQPGKAKKNDEPSATGRAARQGDESEKPAAQKGDADGSTASRPRGQTEDPDRTL